MNLEELGQAVKAMTGDELWKLLDVIERNGNMKLIAITRYDIEQSLCIGWSMSDEQWQKFTASYFWRKGIDENVDYNDLYCLAHETWDELGFDDPNEGDN
jgi:hypothetical protein